MQRELVYSLKQICKAYILLAGALGTFAVYQRSLDSYIWFKRNELLADYGKLKKSR